MKKQSIGGVIILSDLSAILNGEVIIIVPGCFVEVARFKQNKPSSFIRYNNFKKECLKSSYGPNAPDYLINEGINTYYLQTNYFVFQATVLKSKIEAFLGEGIRKLFMKESRERAESL